MGFWLAAGYSEVYGRVIAVPGIAEKGSLNVRIKVTSPGGHSSLPPSRTVSLLILNSSTNRF
jgi:acetylornithine deacetylase/succinyl-diaminopimelate desuccinylase-like protein